MTEEFSEKELQSNKTWDWKSVRRMKPRVVLSVAFSAEEFKKVNEAAEHFGIPTSVFVRMRALSEPMYT